MRSWPEALFDTPNVFTPPQDWGGAQRILLKESAFLGAAEIVIPSQKESLLAAFWALEFRSVETRIKEVVAGVHEAAHIYSDKVFSQKRFWNFFDRLDAASRLWTRGKYSGLLDDSLRLDQFGELELSAREIELIFERIFASIDNLVGIDLVQFVHENLRREIEIRARRLSSISSTSISLTLESTRDRVLSLSIRTGNSPPVLAFERLAGSKAIPVNYALQVTYESIPEQENRSYLSNAVRKRCSAARIRRGARNHAPIGGIAQSSRCGCNWTNSAMDQSERSLRSSC